MLRWETEGDGGRAALIERVARRLLGFVAWFVLAVAASVAAVVAGLAIRSQNSFQSDDVAQLVALRSWARSGVSTYFSGANTYALRFPLAGFVDRHTEPGKFQLYLLTAILLVGGAVCLVVVARLQARPGLGVISGALAAAWVVSNPGVADAIARPTVRNVELGVAALGLAALDRLADRPPPFRWLTLAVTAVALALFLFNDPYFTLLVAGPAIALGLIAALLSRSLWRLCITLTLVVGVIGSRLLDSVNAFGIDALQVPFKYPKPAERQRAKDLVFKQLPNAMATKREVTRWTEQQVAANRLVVALLIVCAVLTLLWCIRRWRDIPVGALTAAFMVIVPSLAWYASSNMFTDDRSWRYIMMTPFVLPILLVPAASALPHGIRPAFLGLSALLIGYSLWCNLTPAKKMMDCGLAERCVPVITTDIQKQDRVYAAWLENYAVQKVLVPYWHSNTTTYLSDDRVHAVTIDCDNHRLITWRWLITDARITEPVTTSHLVLEGGHAAGCSQADIVRQIGPPRSVTKFSDYLLWEYDGDIAARIPTRLG